jgi:7,8-didemethyl-8-hydroxy-5-deazariboflavin synthase CofG subunit
MPYAHHEVNPEFEDLLGRALAGQPLSREDGYRLIQARASELPALMAAASVVRDRGRDRTVTYSRKVFIPLTNLCRQKCGYCTFSRRPEDPLAHTMTPDEVLAVAEAGREAGCKEALFSLGERPEEVYDSVREELARFGHDSTISYLREMCERVLFETGLLPHANPGVMSREELTSLRGVTVSMGLMLETVSERLTEPGMAHDGCPGKHPQVRIQTIRAAGELDIPFTTGILVGIGETREERVDSLFAIRELHEEYGHVQEVIIQNFRVKENTLMRHADEPSVLEMLRSISAARLILGPGMNIQAPPNLTPDGYSLYLLAGINDWGGISPLTPDFINPEAPWPQIVELRRVSEDAGFQLRERLALYPEFATCDRFLRESCRDRVQVWADGSGLVRREAQQW